MCFVNGIPLIVIEAKRPNASTASKLTLDEAISQHLCNQMPKEIPHLYVYSQLLLAINGVDARYATQGTASDFWTVWQDEDFSKQYIEDIKNSSLENNQQIAIFKNRPHKEKTWYDALIAEGKLVATKQDELLIGKLSPERLLEFIRLFILFDKKKGKIVDRYPQVFAVKRLIERLSNPEIKGNKGVLSGTQQAQANPLLWCCCLVHLFCILNLINIVF